MGTKMKVGAAGAPYAKVRPWMGDEGLKLKGQKLALYALLWERDAEPDEDTGRIDAAYVCLATGMDDGELFKALCDLAAKDRLVRVDMSSTGGMLEGFRADPALLEGAGE